MEKFKPKSIFKKKPHYILPVSHKLEAPHKNVLFLSQGLGHIGFGDLTGYWSGAVARMGYMTFAEVKWKMGGWDVSFDPSIDMYTIAQFPQFLFAIAENHKRLKRWKKAVKR